MRKWLGLGGVGVGLSLGLLWWAFGTRGPEPIPKLPHLPLKHEGNAEASDILEPLIVEQVPFALALPPAAELPPLTRVSLAPGMRQGPRPDGLRPRMPYADETPDLARDVEILLQRLGDHVLLAELWRGLGLQDREK